MPTIMTGEYRQLGYDTSNDMILHDSRRGMGEYEEAALHIRDAGLGRIRMGQMMYDAGEFALAAEDWLSAAACFYLVPDLKRMEEATERVRKLNREGKIPPERRDLHAALKEREEQIRALGQKLAAFQQEYMRLAGPDHAARQETLDWLLRQVREYPGSPSLHTAIATQAQKLGQPKLADTHLESAEQFQPENPDHRALRVRLLIESGNPREAVQLGRDLLRAHPELLDLRMRLARTIGFPEGGTKGDWEEAIKILQEGLGDVPKQLAPLALAVMLRYALRHEAEYNRVRRCFDQVAEASQSAKERGIVARLRQESPQIFPRPGSNGSPPRSEPDYRAMRDLSEQLNPLAGAVA